MTETDHHHLVIVGCGAAKRDTPAIARELYTSTYFALKREYAETVGDEWCILSAEHGVVFPDERIAPYETTIDDLDEQALERWVEAVSSAVETWGFRTADDDDAATIELLAGQAYIDPLREQLAAMADLITVEYPFEETAGIGEQMGWLSEQIEAAR